MHRNLANNVYNRFASYICGRKIPDLTSGFRGIRAPIAREILPLLPNTFSYPTTMTIALIRSGYSVAYHPIKTMGRAGASKSKIKIFRDGTRFLLIIFKISHPVFPHEDISSFQPADLHTRPVLRIVQDIRMEARLWSHGVGPDRLLRTDVPDRTRVRADRSTKVRKHHLLQAGRVDSGPPPTRGPPGEDEDNVVDFTPPRRRPGAGKPHETRIPAFAGMTLAA